MPTRKACNWSALSPDGRLLATVTFTEKSAVPDLVLVWEVATGRLLRTIEGHRGAWTTDSVPEKGHGGAVADVAFSPDGRTLATAGLQDKTVRLCDVLTGEQIACLKGHEGGVTTVAFSPDGKTLASGSFDTTILLWDVRKFLAPNAAKAPDDKEMRRLWDELGNGDPVKGYQATASLASAGRKAVALLKNNLRPVAKPDPARVKQLIRDLDAKVFATRQKATGELARLGEVVEPALRQALKDASKDARIRLEVLLADLRPWVRETAALRHYRGLLVLERIGSPEALRLLQSLAQGSEDARLTREARAARDRLRKRSSSSK